MRPTALVTGVGRCNSLGAAIAVRLAAEGWDLALVHLPGYETRVGISSGDDDADQIADECQGSGATVMLLPADLTDPVVPEQLVRRAGADGTLTALVLAHSEGVDSSILDATVASWDRHYAVNARASWLLIKAFAESLPDHVKTQASGRIVALTSDHSAFNLPYGTSKGALDRLVTAAAIELAPLGVRSNAINPGPIDTGWMTPEIKDHLTTMTPAGRLGTPSDTADLVAFLLSEQGGWITGQVLHSNGGFGVA
ncbi:SDR family oxidoreductase [Kocuria sp.]|uniref:SDR family oxidoreductase n=1 Tax=Kocuria sp. TaxID=1871328 RepID=UPI0026DBE78E|nr:SDR family oxidoreductase [Kocuria sp.]MDO4917922.1 SDR family oxidoreductase [Kocuria sp.]